MSKTAKEKFKTYKNVFDAFTVRTLFKLITQRHFIGLESPICIGKESNVFTAKAKDTSIIVKVYRLETADFKRMYDYLKFDVRFERLKRQRRRIIFAWAQREYRNLIKAREGGVSVPKPITFLNNVLLLEMIGKDDPAPKLKDKRPKNPKAFLKKIINEMKKLHKANLVHGDLSEFNILNNNENPIFIDFSQCTTLNSGNAMELFDRDIRNIVRFYKKLKIELNEEKIKKEIIS